MCPVGIRVLHLSKLPTVSNEWTLLEGGIREASPLLDYSEQVPCSAGQRHSRQWPPVSFSFWQSRLTLGSCLSVHSWTPQPPTARPSWLVVALQDNAFKATNHRPLVLRHRFCSVGQGTLGLDNFPPELTIPRIRTLLLDPDGPSDGNKPPWLSRVMPSEPQLPVSQLGGSWCPSPDLFDVAILLLVGFSWRYFRPLDLLLLTWRSRSDPVDLVLWLW